MYQGKQPVQKIDVSRNSSIADRMVISQVPAGTVRELIVSFLLTEWRLQL